MFLFLQCNIILPDESYGGGSLSQKSSYGVTDILQRDEDALMNERKSYLDNVKSPLMLRDSNSTIITRLSIPDEEKNGAFENDSSQCDTTTMGQIISPPPVSMTTNKLNNLSGEEDMLLPFGGVEIEI